MYFSGTFHHSQYLSMTSHFSSYVTQYRVGFVSKTEKYVYNALHFDAVIFQKEKSIKSNSLYSEYCIQREMLYKDKHPYRHSIVTY